MKYLNRVLCICIFLPISFTALTDDTQPVSDDPYYYSTQGHNAYIEAQSTNDSNLYHQAAKYWKTSADRGVVDDQFRLAMLYCSGQLGYTDFETANHYFQLAANQDHMAAAYYLGSHLLDGTGIDQNIEAGERWLRKSADANYLPALVNLGVHYSSTKREVQAHPLFLAAAKKGHHKSQYYVGRNYIFGRGTSKDVDEGLHWLNKAVEGEWWEAAYFLGMIYQYGTDGVLSNSNRAFPYFELAAKNNDKLAQYELGKYFQAKPRKSFSNSNEEAALKWFTASAKQGYSEAQYELGKHYQNNNNPAAFQWFSRAAKQGQMDAAVELGFLHQLSYAIHKGSPKNINDVKGIPADIHRAERLYIQGTNSGLSEGYRRLGQLYLYWQEEFPKKHNRAYIYLEKAAKLDPKSDASRTLGHIYSRQIAETGGAPYDKDKALFWYGKARQAGFAVDKYVQAISASNSEFDWYGFGLLLGTAFTPSTTADSDNNEQSLDKQAMSKEQTAYYKCWEKNKKRITYCSTSIAYCDSTGCRYDATCRDSWNGCESAIELSNSSGAYYCDTKDKWNYHEDFEVVMAGICSP